MNTKSKNKNKIKLSIIALLTAMLLFLTACGNNAASNNDEEAVGTCTLLVECSTIFDNMDDLDSEVEDYVPESGVIFEEQEVEMYDGDSVYDILNRELKAADILMEVSFTGDSVYVEGIDNIYEFSCGELSGWMYCVNGDYPGVSCSGYYVEGGDVIEWHYTCDLGEDLE